MSRAVSISHAARILLAVALTTSVANTAGPAGFQVPPPPEGAPTTPALQRLLAQREVDSIADGYAYAEGPLWHRDGYLLFADSPRDRLHKWDPASKAVTVFREPSAGATALGFDHQGRLLATEHRNRRISRTEPDGSIVTVVDRFEGKRLNSPNDFVVGRDGTLFFTDPPYGLLRQVEGKELDFQGVYRLDRDGRLRLLVRDMVRPNGIGLSTDGRTLYVTDSDRAHLRAFTIREDGSVDGGRVLAEMRPWKAGVQGVPDGLAVSAHNHILVTGPGGVWVFDPKGGRLGIIPTPEPPSACTFGDADGKTLYITARSRVYRIRMTVGGR
jgi:gluconolactonase